MLDQGVGDVAPVSVKFGPIVGFRRAVFRDRQADVERGVKVFDIVFVHVRILFLCSRKSMTASVMFTSFLVTAPRPFR